MLVAAAEQPIVHLMALLGYLVKILLLLIQLSDLLRPNLARELVDEEILEDVKVLVSFRWKQTLIPVGKSSDCFSLAHSDQLSKGVVPAHLVGSTESLDHRYVGFADLLATYSIPLLP